MYIPEMVPIEKAYNGYKSPMKYYNSARQSNFGRTLVFIYYAVPLKYHINVTLSKPLECYEQFDSF